MSQNDETLVLEIRIDTLKRVLGDRSPEIDERAYELVKVALEHGRE